MAGTIGIDIQVLQGIFGQLTAVQRQLDGLAGAAGHIDAAMADATAGVRQSLGGVTGAVNNTEAAMDTAMRGMVGDIMGPLAKTHELEQKLQDLGGKVRTSRSVGEIVKLKKEISATQKELDRVNTGGMEKKVSGAAGRMRNAFSSLVAPIAGAFAVSGITAFVGGVAKAAGVQQQFDASLKNMLQSKERADALSAQVKGFAATTPFELPEVQDATRKMLAFGFGAEETIPTLRRLGDVAAGLGQPVGDLAYLYGTTRVQGRLYTNDLMQFANRGIPIIEELSKVLGVSQAEVRGLVEKGKVGFPQVEQVFKNLTAAGSKFGGLMEAQSHTITGQMSNLSDAWGQFKSDLGQSMAPLITSVIGGLSGGIEYLRDTFEWVQAHGPLVKGVLTGIAVAVGVYTAALAVNSTTTFYNTLLTKGAVVALGLQTVWTNLATAATSLWTGAQWLLNAALTANPIGVVVMAIAALVAGVIYAWYHFESFRAGVMGVWEVLKATFAWVASAVRPIIDGLVLGFQLWWASVQATWAALVGMFQDIGTWLGHVWEGVQGFIGKVTEAFSRLADILMAPFKKVFEVLSHIPGFSKLVGFANDIGNKVGSAFSRGQEEGIADFNAEAVGKAKGGTTNAKAIAPTGNVGAASLLGGAAPGAPAATGGAGATVSGSGGGDKNIAMNITMNMQFGIGRDVQQSARDTAEQVAAMITNKLRDAQFALG